MNSLRAIVIFQNYFGNHVKSSQIHLFAPLLTMRRCTMCLWGIWPTVFKFGVSHSQLEIISEVYSVEICIK